MSAAIHNYSEASSHGHATNSSDVGIGLVAAPDPDRARLVHSGVGDVNVVAPAGHTGPGVKTDRDVPCTGLAVLKGKGAHRRVGDATGIGQEGLVTAGDVVNPDRVLV